MQVHLKITTYFYNTKVSSYVLEYLVFPWHDKHYSLHINEHVE